MDKLAALDTNRNVRYLIAKLVTNRATLFQRFAPGFYRPLLTVSNWSWWRPPLWGWVLESPVCAS